MKIYDLGPFRLNVADRTLTNSGAPVALGVHAIGVLSSLIEHAPDVAPKARIIDAVWPKVVVEEGNLATQIYAIRRVLSQVPGGDRWIETLSGRGYRYVGPIAKRSPDRRIDDAKRSNLPEPLTTFIGRDRELVELKRLLATNRLVTILGTGGIGKTRLALQLGAEIVDAYHDGVWIAELESIRDPALLPVTVSQLFDLGEKSRRTTPIEALCAYLQSRQVLLIVDNCEHLVDACATLADNLLRACGSLAIIATSREPLRVAGEQSYSLEPLSLPDLKSRDVAKSEAVQLFVERAQEHMPNFALTPDRAAAVASICVHLDGIPLALELAAARVRSLSVEQINTRLGDRFRLLAGGSRAAPPRQQTLRTTLDWSYDLLGEGERTVLRRLSIFPGSFTLEAASAVASDDRLEALAVVDVLEQLVSRSLVSADTAIAGSRYRLLETTRAYTAEKLGEAEKSDEIAQRHAQFFGRFFEPALDNRLHQPAAMWRSQYVPELDNVRVALDWTLGGGGDSKTGVALAGASAELWGTLGLFGEGIRRLRRAIDCVEAQTPTSDQARLWLWLGRLVDETPMESRAAFERAAHLYQQVGDSLGLGHALIRLGRVLAFMGDLEQADTVMTEAYALLQSVAPPRLMSLYFAHSAFLKTFAGDLRGARANYEMSLAHFRQSGDEFGALAIIGNLANVAWALGDLDAAAAATREQISLLRDSPVSTRRLLGYALSNLAGILTETGDLDAAIAAAREGLLLVQEDGSAWVFADHLALWSARAGRLADAARLAGYADVAWNERKAKRQPNEARAHEQLHALLRAKLAAAEFDQLRAEGAKMTEDDACRLALE